jgi:hypothetical protein
MKTVVLLCGLMVVSSQILFGCHESQVGTRNPSVPSGATDTIIVKKAPLALDIAPLNKRWMQQNVAREFRIYCGINCTDYVIAIDQYLHNPSTKVNCSRMSYHKVLRMLSSGTVIREIFWDGSGYLIEEGGICRSYDVSSDALFEQLAAAL